MKTKSKIGISLLVFVILIVSDFYLNGPITNLLVNFGINQFHGKKSVEIHISNVNKTTSDTVRIQLPEKSLVHNLKISVKGELNDTATLNSAKLLPGKIDTIIYNGDWYQKEIIFKYEPHNTTLGHLTLDFTFYYSN